MCIFDGLNHEQQATFRAIFADPPRSDVSWTNVLSLMNGLSGWVEHRGGTLFVREYDDKVCVSIHYRGEPIRYTASRKHHIGYLRARDVEGVRYLLVTAGIEPDN